MDDVRLNTPCIIKLGSFAGKIKYCLIDAFIIPILKNFKLKIKCINHQLIVIAYDGLIDMPLHYFIWEYYYQCIIPDDWLISHCNEITMDNRLENLVLISNEKFYYPFQSSCSKNFYWKIVSYLPVDMDEINYHNSVLNESSLYECHNAPCTQLLINSSNEQFNCQKCQKIKYCSQFCRTMDADIHSIFCNPSN